MNVEMIESESWEKSQALLAELLFKSGVMKNEDNIRESALAVGRFLGKPFKVEYLSETGVVQVSCETKAGNSEIVFSRDSLMVSNSDEVGFGEFCTRSPSTRAITLSNNILLFVLKDRGSVRLVEQYGRIEIEHFKYLG